MRRVAVLEICRWLRDLILAFSKLQLENAEIVAYLICLVEILVRATPLSVRHESARLSTEKWQYKLLKVDYIYHQSGDADAQPAEHDSSVCISITAKMPHQSEIEKSASDGRSHVAFPPPPPRSD